MEKYVLRPYVFTEMRPKFDLNFDVLDRTIVVGPVGSFTGQGTSDWNINKVVTFTFLLFR